MGKHRGRRRNFAKYINGAIDLNSALSTLGPKAIASKDVSRTVVDTARISSVRCTHTLSGFTPIENAGPVVVGVAHSDYTGTEIEAYLESASSWDFGDKIAKEIRSRLIRIIGVFDTPQDAAKSAQLNEGRPITTKLNWLLAEGDTLQFWAYNSGPAAFATTDPNYHVTGKANIWMQ